VILADLGDFSQFCVIFGWFCFFGRFLADLGCFWPIQHDFFTDFDWIFRVLPIFWLILGDFFLGGLSFSGCSASKTIRSWFQLQLLWSPFMGNQYSPNLCWLQVISVIAEMFFTILSIILVYFVQASLSWASEQAMKRSARL
jgi:hypothetical protein